LFHSHNHHQCTTNRNREIQLAEDQWVLVSCCKFEQILVKIEIRTPKFDETSNVSNSI